MKLYLQNPPSGVEKGSIVETQDNSNLTRSINYGQEISFVYEKQDDLILEEGLIDLDLRIRYLEPNKTSNPNDGTHHLIITPFVLYVDSDGNTEILKQFRDEFTVSGKQNIRLQRSELIDTSTNLDDKSLIVNIKVGLNYSGSTSGLGSSSVEILNESSVDFNLVPGGSESFTLATRAEFRRFVRRESLEIYSLIDLKERIDYYDERTILSSVQNGIELPESSLYTAVKFHENVSVPIRTKFKVWENVGFDHYTRSDFTESSGDHISDIDFGDYSFPLDVSDTYDYQDTELLELREKRNLKEIIDEFHVPELVYPEREEIVEPEHHLFQKMAHSFVSTLEMMNSERVFDRGYSATSFTQSSDGSVKSYTAKNDSRTNLIQYVRASDPNTYWSLKLDHAKEVVSTSFNTWIYAPNDNDSLSTREYVTQADALLFSLRYVPDGTSITVQLNEGISPLNSSRSGRLILDRKANSIDREMVWLWENPRTTKLDNTTQNRFMVQLNLRASTSLNPSFFGKSAGIMVV